MSTYNYTVLGVRRALEQIVQNIDAQRKQIVAAVEREYPTPISLDNPEPDSHRQLRLALNRDLVPFYVELERARAALVNAHGEISGTVPGYVTHDEPIR